VAINTEAGTADVVHRYLDAWTKGDLQTVRSLLAVDVAVECNLGWPTDPERLLQSLATLAQAIEGVTMVSELYEGPRAILLYDCVLREPPGAIRTLEALTVAAGSIREVRRTYDMTAVLDLLPALTPLSR
jgi:hypothetical protein